jgi:phosphate transport system substrate-binding protein
MNMVLSRGTWVAAALSALALAACSPGGGKTESAVAPGEAPAPGGGSRGGFTVTVDGSSTVYPIAEAAAAAFQSEPGRKVLVTVAESGTGGGFRKFCRGETHVQGASRPILAAEMTQCAAAGVSYIEIPIAFDALSVVVHPSNPLKEISVADLKKIWEPEAQGKITNWRQVNPVFPNLPLTLYGAGPASGTFDYFTEAVVGRSKASRTDYTPSEDDNVLVQGISNDKSALGYFGMSYYVENRERVRALAIKKDAASPAVYPSIESVQAGQYLPLARPLFVYVNAAELDKKPVADFVNYYITNAPALAAKVNFVPLPPRAYEVGLKRIADREAGTAFGGKSDVGGSIEEVLARKVSKTITQ